jgi:hypothetical protein
MCGCCVIKMPAKGECCTGEHAGREFTVTIKVKCEPGEGECCSGEEPAATEPKAK